MSVTHIDVPVPVPTEGECPVRDVLTIVGDKWSVLTIIVLGKHDRRFNQLHRDIPGISQRMLTRTLAGLVHNGLVSRTVHPTIPPRVDYALTDLGRGLLRHLDAFSDWATTHHDDIVAARRVDDANRAAESA